MVARPFALSGFLPAWDLEQRALDVAPLVAWTHAKLAELGADGPLEAIRVDGPRALDLAQRLTVASLKPDFRGMFHALLRELLPELPWDRVWLQTYAHFRILVPRDEHAVVRAHTDFGFAHGLDERNVWIALTDALGDAALHALPFRESMALVQGGEWIAETYDVSSLRAFSVPRGTALLFTPLHVHGARPPRTHTRVSIDVRVVPARHRADLSFSPLRASA